MADISKCDGENCPLKESCYRFTVESNPLWQSYFSEVPYDKEKEECNYYLKNERSITKI
jgi:hypothetical protein